MSDTDTPLLTATYLGVGNHPQLSESSSITCQSPVGGPGSLTDNKARGGSIGTTSINDTRGHSGSRHISRL